MEETDAQPRILHLARLSLKNKGEMKTYLDLKRNKIQRTFVASRPDLWSILKRALQAEIKDTKG